MWGPDPRLASTWNLLIVVLHGTAPPRSPGLDKGGVVIFRNDHTQILALHYLPLARLLHCVKCFTIAMLPHVAR